MKKFLKRTSICILVFILLVAVGVGLLYRQSQPYATENTTTQTTILRVAKMKIRNGLNKTHNPSLASMLQSTYNILHKYSIALAEKATETKREHTIQTDTDIIGISTDLPGNIISEISTMPTEQGYGIAFSYNNQYLGSLQIYTQSGGSALESGGLVNEEKITEQSGYILSYTQVLDNPFTGMELEVFSEIVSIFNQSIGTTQITNIQKLEYTLGYIVTIQTGDTVSISIDPIQLVTGEVAAKAREQYDPEGCAAAISGTDQKSCIPANDYYIINESTGDNLTLNTDEVTTIQIVNAPADSEIKMDTTTIEHIQENMDKYSKVPFHVYYSNNIILQLSEQYLP